MIRAYLAERRSWLLLLAAMHALLLTVAYLDASIPFWPIVYIAALNGIACALFVAFRCGKESRFYRRLNRWDEQEEGESFQEADSPFERIVQEAVHAQTERYRQEAEERRQLLEREKDELLSWIHEVKTPLTAMQLMLERLPEDSLKDGLFYEWLRIHHLLDQQLHQRRLPFMHNDIVIGRVKLEPIVNQEIRALRSWCIPKGIGFDVSLAAEEAPTDSKWLGFIVRQLLTNAVKYSDSGEIAVGSFRRDGQIVLEVRDCGRGIAAKDLPRIFDKGFTSTESRQEGAATGMGLYLARQAARALSIDIRVQSRQGEGTVFALFFPPDNEWHRLNAARPVP